VEIESMLEFLWGRGMNFGIGVGSTRGQFCGAVKVVFIAETFEVGVSATDIPGLHELIDSTLRKAIEVTTNEEIDLVQKG